MKSISFLSIKQVNSKLITFKCIEETENYKNEYDFYYEFNTDNFPSNNALATSFSCLLGKKQYEYIYI